MKNISTFLLWQYEEFHLIIEGPTPIFKCTGPWTLLMNTHQYLSIANSFWATAHTLRKSSHMVSSTMPIFAPCFNEYIMPEVLQILCTIANDFLSYLQVKDQSYQSPEKKYTQVHFSLQALAVLAALLAGCGRANDIPFQNGILKFKPSPAFAFSFRTRSSNISISWLDHDTRAVISLLFSFGNIWRDVHSDLWGGHNWGNWGELRGYSNESDPEVDYLPYGIPPVVGISAIVT